MPHSPRWYQGKLWLLESGEGSLARVDLEQRHLADGRTSCPGSRGASTSSDRWLSSACRRCVRARSSAASRWSSGVRERTCGVWVVNIETGQTVGFLRFEAGVQEIFAVQVLRGHALPRIAGMER